MRLSLGNLRTQYLSPIVRSRFCSQMAASATVKVQVKQGQLVGKQHQLANGTPFNSFQGIPYAHPPLGELRFKSPVPMEQFATESLDCTSERNISHQRDPFTQEIVGSEDCLYLNVYAPQAKQCGLLPVMVWIHGGGFFFGNCNSDYFYPLGLLTEKVVVVTLNYRLGALGFLSLPEEGIWGNAGLKDQRLALQWVHENITQFNGNPNNVTIFGESAGAACVHLHAYASHSNKLFHKAIMQSGTANMEWVFQASPDIKTRRLCQLLGCASSSTKEMAAFLQSEKVTPLAILSNTLSVMTPDERRRGLPLCFKPVVEDAASPDSFITTPIMDMLRCRDTLAMPTLMGYNSAEGIAMMVNAVRHLPQYDEDLERFVPRNIPLPPDDAAIKKLAQKMRDFYFGGQALTENLFDALTDLLSDYHFTVDMQHAAALQVNLQPRAPLFFYRFEYIGGRNVHKRIFQFEQLRGACHGDELFYLFQMAEDSEPLKAADALMTQRICRLWANFARDGSPTPHGAEPPILNCAWPPVLQPVAKEKDSIELTYLAIGKKCEVKRNPDRKRIEFWRKIYRSYSATDYSRLSAKL